jgi:DNA end-binding protein Ku
MHMASRPIWSGVVSFGLLNIPVSLMSGEKRTDLHFRMLDCRNNAPVRYERVNAETGEEVPWSNVCKAYEYDKGNFVVLEKGDLATAKAKGDETVEIEAFVDAADIDPRYYERPYVLVPGKKADKGYVLLRDTLQATRKVGIARVVVRTREYLCALMPIGPALVIVLLRYAKELVDFDEFVLPAKTSTKHKVSPREVEMARSLIESMAVKWNPADYKDEFGKRMRALIDKRVKKKRGVSVPKSTEAQAPDDTATNVVDFMALLKRSLDSQRRSPAKKSVVARKAVPAKKKAAARKSASVKAARKPAVRKSG